MTNVVLRSMTEQDIDGVLSVEHESFSVPWNRSAFHNEVTNNRFALYVVAESDGEIIGYAGMWLIIDEAHITNVAVLPNYRGKRIGKALLTKIMEMARAYGAIKMTLEVRASNEVAKRLYRQFGFEMKGVRKNYYSDNQEDAEIMWVNLYDTKQ